VLLSGKSIEGLANAGPIVQACFLVGRNTILAAGADPGKDERSGFR
jgi:assimilatory nitrate reductase catalytic subunit